MYTDSRLTSRDGWKYTYKGSDLYEGARVKLNEVSHDELKARNTLTNLIGDTTVSASDKRVNEAKNEIESLAEMREKLIVFVHEFHRNLDREYSLSIGDVVFFKLINTDLIFQ